MILSMLQKVGPSPRGGSVLSDIRPISADVLLIIASICRAIYVLPESTTPHISRYGHEEGSDGSGVSLLVNCHGIPMVSIGSLVRVLRPLRIMEVPWALMLPTMVMMVTNRT